MKYGYILVGLLAIFGCTKQDNSVGQLDYSPGLYTYKAYKTCIDGVTYILYDRGITIVLDRDSKVVPCQ